jgi:DNA-binding NarL/FixJ family response regulator
MIDYFGGFAGRARAQQAAGDALRDLTERERQILGLIAQGRSNPAIAAQLMISVKTVQNYVSSIFAKLQVEDRAQAMLRARDAGLGGPGG